MARPATVSCSGSRIWPDEEIGGHLANGVGAGAGGGGSRATRCRSRRSSRRSTRSRWRSRGARRAGAGPREVGAVEKVGFELAELGVGGGVGVRVDTAKRPPVLTEALCDATPGSESAVRPQQRAGVNDTSDPRPTLGDAGGDDIVSEARGEG